MLASSTGPLRSCLADTTRGNRYREYSLTILRSSCRQARIQATRLALVRWCNRRARSSKDDPIVRNVWTLGGRGRDIPFQNRYLREGRKCASSPDQARGRVYPATELLSAWACCETGEMILPYEYGTLRGLTSRRLQCDTKTFVPGNERKGSVGVSVAWSAIRLGNYACLSSSDRRSEVTVP